MVATVQVLFWTALLLVAFTDLLVPKRITTDKV